MEDQTTQDWADLLVSGGALAVVVGVYVLVLVAYVRIIQKAGYSGWWVLIGLVPVLNVVMFFVFAFARWPVLRELDAWRARGQGPVPPY